MSRSSHPNIRNLLHHYHDGLTSIEISERLELKPDSVRNALKDMPDTYIDRWKPVANEPPHAVWCAVVPPEDCPRPTTKDKHERPTKLRSMEQRESSEVRY
jgi:hypothetical protein